MAGFYRSSYTRANGQPAVMAVTQFEPIDARRCFPCWDEPARKAVFNVTLTIPRDLMALSNMPESREEFVAGDRKQVAFLPTPKMSTYLLAFCVGEYESMSRLTRDGVLLRVFSVPGKRAACAYALECGVRALEFYNDVFGLPFPLPKMDMVAVPDFAAGAMENWGLVTYREVDLLCDVATVSVARKQRICTVVAHELAHQWFGNLVTMAWWEDLWLNEGFANWMQTFCSDHLSPEWEVWTAYVAEQQQNALSLDGLRTSHPIQVPIMHAQEVEEVFDAISYCKGGSLVRMLYRVLGDAPFREGLRLYFNRHKYSNTETRDLAAAWAEVSGLPIGDLVESWTLKMGFPLLRVRKDPFEGGVLEVEQSWFLADGSAQPGDEAVTWMVPLHVGIDGAAAPGPLQFARAKSTSLPVAIAGAQWLKLNFGQHVPCRVLYPPSMVARLAAHMPSLPAEDRIGLLSDAFALCRAGHESPEQLIALLGAYCGEANDKVWSELASTLLRLNQLIRSGLEPDVADAFRQFAAKIITPKAREVGWEPRAGESDNAKRLRAIMAGLVTAFCSGEEWVREEVTGLFERLMRAGSGDPGVSQDVRSAVLSITVRNDPSSATFERLQRLHSQSNDDALKREIYVALGKGSPEVQHRALAWNLTDEVKAQDMVHLPTSVATSGPAGAEANLQWVKENYTRIYARLGTTSMMLFAHIVRSTGAGFVTREKAVEVEEFWRGCNVYHSVRKTVGQTREAIETNAQFVDRLRASPLSSPAFWAEK
eukprot:GGOE01003939.1.p1 GENE.GGOE01003939.1~~GGOE01003939.1.p1  ORF type:complete len:881 (+),score=297.17 GGOE01003939.1:348-2645(+)